MQAGLTISITLHAAVVAAIWVGLPSFGEPMAPSESVPVEVVSSEEFKARTRPQKPDPPAQPEKTQTANAEPAKPSKPEPADSTKRAPPAPEPAPTPEKAPPDAPPAPQSTPEPEQAQSGPPDVPKPRPKPELQVARAAQPEPEEQAKPEPEPAQSPEPESRQPAETDETETETAETPPPRPQTKPRVRMDDTPKQKADEPQEDQLTSILKDVESELSRDAPSQPQQDDTATESEKPATTQQAKTEPEAEPTPTAREQLSAGQIANVRRQLQDCWRVPAGAKNAANLVVEIAVQLNRDGSVRHAEIATTERMNDSFYRAAAESALRAVHICSPLEGLPVDKYQSWQRMRLTFDPQEMFGS